MSEQLHPGLHPDPDSLNAFVEGVLPEHERLQCLAHLAECPRCREVVFLAQEPPPAPDLSRPLPARTQWFAPIPVFAAAAVLCLTVLGVWFYLHRNAGIPSRDTIARVNQAPLPPEPPAPPTITPELPSSKPDRAATQKTAPRAFHGTGSAPVRNTAPPILPAPPIPNPTTVGGNVQPPLLTATIPEPPKPETRDQRAAISGTVTDPTGAIVSGATVKVTAASGAVAVDARTDGMGRFNLSDLPAGRYELQIGAPGFRQTSSQVELQPRETASVKTQLEVGSVSETVEVTAAPSTIQTEQASTGKTARKKSQQETPRPLPSKLPADISTASGKTMLAVDSAGTLFVSRNSGKSWKAVKAVWPGKVRSIALADPPTANATFQLTTDSGMIWWSRDGTRWSMAPSRQ